MDRRSRSRIRCTSCCTSPSFHSACVGPIGSAPSYLGQPRLGDANFALTLPLPTAPVLAAIVGFTEVPLPCGPCTLILNADLVIAGGGPHGIPIPCDPSWIGGQFTTQ